MGERAGTLDRDEESRANELYWDSDWSVNRIAEELDLSRGALYALIQPLATGIPCPDCEGELQYPNRTARERTLVTCAGCGLEESEAVVLEAWRERDGEAAPALAAGRSGEAREAWGAGVLLAAGVLALSASLLYLIRRRRT